MTIKLNIIGLPYRCDWEDRLFPYGVMCYYIQGRRRIDELYKEYCIKIVGRDDELEE